MFFPSKKWNWKTVAKYGPVWVDRVGVRNKNGSDRQIILGGCQPGMRVNFRHDPDHPDDPGAVAVLVAGGQQIGNLDPQTAANVAPFLASGEIRFSSRIHSVGPHLESSGITLASAELVIEREDYLAIDRFSLVGSAMRCGRWVDGFLVKLTKGDRFPLGMARAIALFLALFLTLVIVLTLFRQVQRLRGVFD